MRIDLIAVGKDLHLLALDLFFIQTDLALFDLLYHLLVLIEHMVETLCHHSDVIFSLDLETVIRMFDRVVDKSRDPVERSRHVVVGVKDQDVQQYDREKIQRPDRFSDALLKSPVLRDRRGYPYFDASLPVALPYNEVPVVPQLPDRVCAAGNSRRYERQFGDVSVAQKNGRRRVADDIAERSVQSPVVHPEHAHSDGTLIVRHSLEDRIIIVVIKIVVPAVDPHGVEIILRAQVFLVRRKVKILTEHRRFP